MQAECYASRLECARTNPDGPRYFDFVARAEIQEVLGLPLPVARIEDVLQGKIWALQDSERRTSKRHKDLTDVTRILEAYPQLRSQVPAEILAKLSAF